MTGGNGNKMIAYCGLDCAECPAYIHTQANDMVELTKLAVQWSEQFKSDIKPEDCLCDGCTSDGRHGGYCAQCEVRACAVERGVKNCAHCADYACDKLTGFWEMAPQAKANLEAVRAAMD
jgi:hypothetical protein